jgi:hypothetical protein
MEIRSLLMGLRSLDDAAPSSSNQSGRDSQHLRYASLLSNKECGFVLPRRRPVRCAGQGRRKTGNLADSVHVRPYLSKAHEASAIAKLHTILFRSPAGSARLREPWTNSAPRGFFFAPKITFRTGVQRLAQQRELIREVATLGVNVQRFTELLERSEQALRHHMAHRDGLRRDLDHVTNSAKYGALSTAQGRIEAMCAEEKDTVAVLWTENGGPELAGPPTSEGFGSILSHRAVQAWGGKVEREWRPEGLAVRLTLPSSRLTG